MNRYCSSNQSTASLSQVAGLSGHKPAGSWLKQQVSEPETTANIMTMQDLQSIGYIMISGERKINEISYRDYLNEYEGEDKLRVQEIEDDGEIKYKLILHSPAQWKNGRSDGWLFDNEEDAELEGFKRTENWIREKNWDAPVFWDKKEDAIKDLANSLDRSEETIKRYLSIAAITAKKYAAHRENIAIQTAAHKEYLAVAVPMEAASITIDQQFKDDIKAAFDFTGKVKSKACEAALSSLLIRVGVTIVTDFWQILRIKKEEAFL